MEKGYLVYRPFDAFKGPWNEKMQGVNDYVISLCDIVIDMTPPGVLALGTQHEVALARSKGILVIEIPPPVI